MRHAKSIYLLLVYNGSVPPAPHKKPFVKPCIYFIANVPPQR